MRYFFDIETNAIEDWANLTDLTTLHVIVAEDDEGKVHIGNDKESIARVLKLMSDAEEVVGHNVISFDLPALAKLYGFTPKKVVDTLVMSRCIYPDLVREGNINASVDSKLIGSHSLKAWGQRLGEQKDSHGDTETWEKCTQEMIDYCVQDVKVTKKLYLKLSSTTDLSQTMLDIEYAFASLIKEQEQNGFPFDETKAEKLCGKLTAERAKLKKELQQVFKPEVIEMKSYWYVDAHGNKFPTKKAALEVGVKNPKKGPHKTKEIPFNPNSRDQISARLIDLGWRPATFEGKRPKIDESVLRGVGLPEADKLCKYLLLSKRLGQIAEGQQAWLKLSKNKIIYGSVNTNGAVSGRCTHRNPNVAQVPAVRAEYGKECRELFHAPKGKVLVGADASGLELRCLAHYLWLFDDGAYAKEILEGDIHTANQRAAGLETRDQAKTFIYAFLYGAGDEKIGSIVNGNRAAGRRLKSQFTQRIPAIGRLLNAVKNRVKQTNNLKGIDGRLLPCRSDHSALNLLLQSAGAVIMKQALIEFNARATRPYKLHANVHDEIQFSCNDVDAATLGNIFGVAMKEAGKKLGFRCPLDSEYKVGMNWAETH